MSRKKPALGLDPRVDTDFPKRSCSTKKLARQSIQSEAMALALELIGYGSASSAAAVASMASAEAASDQCTPIKLPRSPTETPLNARSP